MLLWQLEKQERIPVDLGAEEASAWEGDLEARHRALVESRRNRELRPLLRIGRAVLRRGTGARARERAMREAIDGAVGRCIDEVEELLKRGEFDLADRLVLAQRVLHPGRIDLLVLHAEVAMSARDWERATDRWRRLIEGFGDGAPEEAQARLSAALRSNGALEEAIRVVDRARPARTASGRIALSFEEAANLMARGDFEASAAQWRQLLEDPDLPPELVPIVREALTSSQRASGRTPDGDLQPEGILARDLASPTPLTESAWSVEQSCDASPQPVLKVDIFVISQGDAVRLTRTRDALAAWDDSSIEMHVIPSASSVAGIDALRRELRGDLFMLIEEGSLVDRRALDAAREVFASDRRIAIVCADEDSIDEHGRTAWPLLRSRFDPDLLLSQPSLGHAVMFRSSAIDEARGLEELPVQPKGEKHRLLFWIWDLALRVMLASARTSTPHATVVIHVPLTLLHRPASAPTDWTIGPAWTGEAPAAAALVTARLREAGDDRSVEPASWGVPLRVRAARPVGPVRVSIIIPTRDRAELLERCLDGVLQRTSLRVDSGHFELDLEVVVVDNDSVDADAMSLLSRLSDSGKIRVVAGPGEFNFSRLINIGVEAASGEVLVLLNNDVVVQDDGWLIELVTQALRAEIGAVGALLEHWDGRVQHAGVLVGVNGTAEHAFREWSSTAAGYLGLLRSVRRVSAVTAACLAIRRDVFVEVGGLDELSLPVELNDVDLCLRVERLGLSVLWTPFARLSHLEGGTRGRGDRAVSVIDGLTLQRQEAQRSTFIERWRERLERDPHYSPRLSTSGATYMLKR